MTATAAPVAPVTGRHRRQAPPRRMLRVLGNVVLGVAAVGAVSLAGLVLVLKLGFAPVLSPSMEPAFAPGDLLVTRAVPATDLKVGDVVVLPRPDAPGERYAHRLISVDASGGQAVVRTKGDANAAADPLELRITSDTVPLVVTDVPVVGQVSLLGQYAWVRIALILLTGGCVLVAAKRALLRR
ncbi:signal peptidase I [Prauserella cavernicola]|uniref:Signal peptidase I n=1 Tax=Prauserella cavernicola TaxID=2800127 RepID=A0A934QR61_9PSEU|nr:signal peptidase I [Prauserella cavernicola]MBK1784608.1 signal peptidase I [Prauserella cavernicola]